MSSVRCSSHCLQKRCGSRNLKARKVLQVNVPSKADKIFSNGEMAQLVRSLDWAKTPLGALDLWPEILLCTVNLILESRFPTAVYWGAQMVLLYNDAYMPLTAEKHPAVLGTRGASAWSEAWHIIGPQFQSVLDGAETIYKENVLIPVRRDGSMQDIYWTYSCSPIRDVSGHIPGVMVVCNDVTGEVSAQRKLRASEARATRILQSIADAVIVTDANTSITEMNPVAEELTRWSMHEAAGRLLSEVFRIVNEHTREPVESPADRVMRLKTSVLLANHTVLIARDGHETHIDDSGAPIRDEAGEITGTVLVFRNINERRAAERERNLLAERLRQVQDATTDSILAIDRDWRITYMNAHALTTTAPVPNSIGKNFWETFPDTIYEGSPYLYHYYRAMDQQIAVEFEAFYPEPLDIWVAVQVRPTDEGIALFFRDVTTLKRTEAALLQNEKLAAVGRLAASIAHEINNPLESVTNLLYLVRQHEDLPEDMQEYLDLADSELRRVTQIITQTLKFYRQSTTPSAITGQELFDAVLVIYGVRVMNAKVKVEHGCQAEAPVLCFEGEIRQVVSNLIGNAVDAMSPRGGRLLLRSRESTHWPTGRRGVTLTIADTGTGISPQIISSIFQAFYTTKGEGGTGLGLWVSKEIVDRHQGILRVRSRHGSSQSGTVFTLFLPFQPATR